MTLLRCCTQYAIEFGKLSSGQRTGKDRSTSQSLRRAVPKNAPTTVELHSFHTLARLCTKSYKVGFSCMWIENSQKYKLDFKGAEELETKLLTCAGLWRKPESSRKTFCFIDYAKAFDCVDHRTLWQVLQEVGVPNHLIYLLRNIYETGSNSSNWIWSN